MAATNQSPRDRDSADELPESGVGMAHPTVVPTNLDADRDDGTEK